MEGFSQIFGHKDCCAAESTPLPTDRSLREPTGRFLGVPPVALPQPQPPRPSKPRHPCTAPSPEHSGDRNGSRFAGSSQQTRACKHRCANTHRRANAPAAEALRRGGQRLGGMSSGTAAAEPPPCTAGASGTRSPVEKELSEAGQSYWQRRHLGYLKPTLLSPLRKVTELVFYPLIRRCSQNLLPTQLSWGVKEREHDALRGKAAKTGQWIWLRRRN